MPDPRTQPIDPVSPFNICDTCGRRYVPTLANDAKHEGCSGKPAATRTSDMDHDR